MMHVGDRACQAHGNSHLQPSSSQHGSCLRDPHKRFADLNPTYCLQVTKPVRHAVSHPSSPAAAGAAAGMVAASAVAVDRLPGYSIGKTIGEGGFCKVRAGVHDMSGQQVAIKVIDKLKLKVSLQLVKLPKLT